MLPISLSKRACGVLAALTAIFLIAIHPGSSALRSKLNLRLPTSFSGFSPSTSETEIEPVKRLHFLLPIDKPNAPFCQCLFTALLNDFEPVLLFFNDTRIIEADSYLKQAYKVQAVLDYVVNNTTDPSDVVLMADSMDVWWQLPAHEVARRFAHMRKPIVFSAEKNCFPYGRWCQGLPESPMPADIYGDMADIDMNHWRPKFVNSGLLMGRAGFLRPLYEFAVVYQSKSTGWAINDQAVMQYAYRSGEYNITLDFFSEMFQSFGHAEYDLLRADIRSGDIVSDRNMDSYLSPPESGLPPLSQFAELDDESKRAFYLQDNFTFPVFVYLNNVTKHVPVAVHFNGGKDVAKDQWPKTWWTKLDGLRVKYEREVGEVKRKVLAGNVTLSKDGRVLGWGEVCGEYPPFEFMK